jgi:hypothetical protein
MRTFRQMAGVAADPVVGLDAEKNVSPLIHAVLAFIVLTIATVLGVYKPGGRTASSFSSSLILAAVGLATALVLAALHLLGSGLHY